MLLVKVSTVTDMPDAWIALDPAARRRNWWWTAVLTLVCASTAIAATLSTATDLWWWAGGVGAFWLFSAFYMINRGYGRTLLTADRIVFHTFLSRRSIPWAEIIRIEKRSHQTRSGQWWDLRIVRVNGGQSPSPAPSPTNGAVTTWTGSWPYCTHTGPTRRATDLVG